MNPKLYKTIIVVILGWTLALGLVLAWRTSATTDEDIHVSGAYLALTRHEFRFDPEHPYVFKYLTAIPLLFLHTNLPADDQQLWEAGKPTLYDSWHEARRWSDEWFFNSGNNGHLMMFLARIPGVLCMVLLCWLTWFLALKWFSPKVALYALIFTAFSPTILGHGHLTNTDVPSSFGFLLTVGALYYYYENPNKKGITWAGAAFALAQTIKFSSLLLTPIAFLWILYVAYKKKIWKQLPLHILIFLGITIVWIWLSYQFPYKLLHGDLFTLYGSTVLPAAVPFSQTLFEKFALLRYILPVDFIKGASLSLGGAIDGRAAYFMGETHTGIWTFFPLLFALKTQIAGLLILITGFALFIVSPLKKLKKWTPLATLLALTLTIFLASAFTSKLTLGIRHILPVLPLIYILMALALYEIETRTKKHWITVILLIAYILPIIISFPHYINYTNAMVQPKNKTYEYFNDSDLDWGQQAQAIVKKVKADYPNENIYSNYFWNPYILSYYGLDYSDYNPENPPTDGIIIVTATELSWGNYGIFRATKPFDHLSNTTYFYRIGN